MGSVFTCKLNPCCGDRRNCEPPRQYDSPSPPPSPPLPTPVSAPVGDRPTGHVAIAHDGFSGEIIGHYITREGKSGVVVQQDGTRVVHVYGEKWLNADLRSPAVEGK
ncbi:hypothetical protein ACHMW7_15995 [Aminobacter sp. UC22_36]|uniref:hypothetical protein n=1 Tax=Aminobacter sp. UC22_36 TaxID=3374549 RepID=UPI00375744B7